MFAHKYTSALAMIAAMAVAAEAGPLSSGVCYSPWHHQGAVNDDILQKDFSQVKQHFSSIRTFHARFSGVNVVDSCAKAGLKVAVGIMMKDHAETEKEIEAVCEGAKRHPNVINAVYVGNENMKNGYHGQYSSGELINYINKVKGCTAGMGVKVGTVQRINEWLSGPGAEELAASCDSIGVNIYPFFTPGDKSPMEKFMDQWNQLKSKGFSEEKLAVTETGWPRQGSPSPQGQVPSKETAQQYLNEFAAWAEGHQESYYFMMYDTTNVYGGGDYETSFGVADKDGNMILQVPSGNGPAPGPAPGPNPYQPTDAPTEAPSDKPTDAPTEAPTAKPTNAPTDAPTEAPSDKPTDAPTEAPTAKPPPMLSPIQDGQSDIPPIYKFVLTGGPTNAPTDAPTDKPTDAPTDAPTHAPTDAPTDAPTGKPGKPDQHTDAPVTPAPTTPHVVTPAPTVPHGGKGYNDTKQIDMGKEHDHDLCK